MNVGKQHIARPNTTFSSNRFLSGAGTFVQGKPIELVRGISTAKALPTRAIVPQREDEASDEEVLALFFEIEPHYGVTNRRLADL